ncbi:TetR/AcrR family transcriptional regulator C-terminal domain-containing protein [Kitasatospora sp. MAA4]|uniref:TetR/AcrR family transcriptional regulator C-terminal domain-containing protein n=1 Tax=Kitasatospora sp. MAA4 TaxID=3035093 RepID=UPI002474173F|nr:TetR/AcrR family transcriptional regulator C-terminal domain-containing protein [Kitasatospora sp. MAA4]
MHSGRTSALGEAPYLRIVAEIRRRIVDGELRTGDRVPSTRQITQEWGVAMATASKVLAALRQEGLVQARPGVGTVVTAELVPAPQAPPPSSVRRPAREGEHGLSRERIVRAAIAIADAEGIAPLSMRRVAAELGVAPMALYRHVPGKDELVTLMADTAIGDTSYPDDPPVGWRARLELVGRLQWEVFKRHPWLAPAMSITRPAPSPNAMRHGEWAISAMDGLPLDPATKLHAHLLLFSYVRGIAFNFELQAQAEQESGITDEEWMDAQESVMRTRMSSGAFPAFSQLMRELDATSGTAGFDSSLDTLFEFGLTRLLDGLGLLIEGRAAAAG